jgi:hypothetical protein
MLDFLFAVGQFLCLLGLLYGLILTVVHRDCVDSLRRHYDPIIGHDWLSIERIWKERPSQAPTAQSETSSESTRVTHAL